MKVFVDTNVLVSAIASRGLSADVFQLILTEHDLITPIDAADTLVDVVG